jgi:hypothetical protein
MVVSPVEVKNNMLSSSPESSSAGLQFLFRNTIPHDSVFQKLVTHNVLNTMINVNDLPETILNEAIATEMV